MADIQFQEPQYGTQIRGPKRSWLTGLVLKTGLAKDDRGAQKVLFVVLVLATIGIIWFAWPGGPSSPAVPLGPPPRL